MRNLTITRTKSFVACIAKMKVYIEDPEAGELTINGTPCRMLGALKNGETATFPIGNQAAKVFVIADKASRNYSNDCYPLSAGLEDVAISGKNTYHPGAGNPFRFEGVTDPEVLANRKKGSRKGIVVLVAALILGFLIGWFKPTYNASTVSPKGFHAEGMLITLTDSFREVSYQGFTQCYESKTVAVFTLKEAFSLVEGMEDYTLEEYGTLVVQANGMGEDELKHENGVYYFDYTALGSDGTENYYFATLHKGKDAFWLIQFATPAANADKIRDQFFTWAASVTFE